MNRNFLRRFGLGGLAGKERRREEDRRADEKQHDHANDDAVALEKTRLVLVVELVGGRHGSICFATWWPARPA